jgi:predicted transposase/invertase (TIGR01784 family)
VIVTQLEKVLREEGITEGRKEEKLVMAKKLLKKIFPLEEISELTELPVEKIKELSNESRQ